MTRHLILLSMLLLPGCGEHDEPSRFVPAKDDAPSVSSSDRMGGDKASGEATVPKNIPMH